MDPESKFSESTTNPKQSRSPHISSSHSQSSVLLPVLTTEGIALIPQSYSSCVGDNGSGYGGYPNSQRSGRSSRSSQRSRKNSRGNTPRNRARNSKSSSRSGRIISIEKGKDQTEEAADSEDTGPNHRLQQCNIPKGRCKLSTNIHSISGSIQHTISGNIHSLSDNIHCLSNNMGGMVRHKSHRSHRVLPMNSAVSTAVHDMHVAPTIPTVSIQKKEGSSSDSSSTSSGRSSKANSIMGHADAAAGGVGDLAKKSPFAEEKNHSDLLVMMMPYHDFQNNRRKKESLRRSASSNSRSNRGGRSNTTGVGGGVDPPDKHDLRYSRLRSMYTPQCGLEPLQEGEHDDDDDSAGKEKNSTSEIADGSSWVVQDGEGREEDKTALLSLESPERNPDRRLNTGSPSSDGSYKTQEKDGCDQRSVNQQKNLHQYPQTPYTNYVLDSVGIEQYQQKLKNQKVEELFDDPKEKKESTVMQGNQNDAASHVTGFSRGQDPPEGNEPPAQLRNSETRQDPPEEKSKLDDVKERRLSSRGSLRRNGRLDKRVSRSSSTSSAKILPRRSSSKSGSNGSSKDTRQSSRSNSNSKKISRDRNRNSRIATKSEGFDQIKREVVKESDKLIALLASKNAAGKTSLKRTSSKKTDSKKKNKDKKKHREIKSILKKKDAPPPIAYFGGNNNHSESESSSYSNASSGSDSTRSSSDDEQYGSDNGTHREKEDVRVANDHCGDSLSYSSSSEGSSISKSFKSFRNCKSKKKQRGNRDDDLTSIRSSQSSLRVGKFASTQGTYNGESDGNQSSTSKTSNTDFETNSSLHSSTSRSTSFSTACSSAYYATDDDSNANSKSTINTKSTNNSKSTANTASSAYNLFDRSRSYYLRTADLGLTQDTIFAQQFLDSPDAKVEPHYHHPTPHPPPGVEFCGDENWICVDNGRRGSSFDDDDEGIRYSPIAPQAVDALVGVGYRCAMDAMMWTPTSKTRKWMTEKGLRIADIPIPGPRHEGEGLNTIHSKQSYPLLLWTGKFLHKYHGHDLPAIRSQGIVNMSPEDLVDLLMDSKRVKEYNKSSVGRNDEVILSHGTNKENCPFSGRKKKVLTGVVMEGVKIIDGMAFVDRNEDGSETEGEETIHEEHTFDDCGGKSVRTFTTRGTKGKNNAPKKERTSQFVGVTKLVRSKNKLPLIRKHLEFVTLLHCRALTDEQGGDGYIIVGRAITPAGDVDDKNGKRKKKDVVRSEILLNVHIIRRLGGKSANESIETGGNAVNTSISGRVASKKDLEGRCLVVSVNHIKSPLIPNIIAKKVGLSAATNFMADIRALTAK